jgi:hypothetical protein
MKTKLLIPLFGFLILSFNTIFSQDFSPNVTEETATTIDCSCVGANALINNPSFETSPSSATDWTTYNGTFISDPYAAQCGTKAGHFNHGDGTGRGGFYQDVAVTAGAGISLKFFGGVHETGPTARLEVKFYNGATLLAGTVVTDVDAILPNMSLYTLTSTAPAGTTKIRIEGSTNGGTENQDWLKVDGFCLTITPVCNAAITGLRFYDTASATTVNIANNGSYDIAALPASFGIEALVSGTAESVTFSITGSATASNTENTPAYTHPGTGTAWPHGTGTFTVVAKVYTADNAGGQLCDTETFTFTLTNNSCSCPGNLVTNPSFETDLSSWFAVNGTLSSNTTYKACGSKGVVLDHTSGTAKILQQINISAALPVGANITFKAYAGTHAAGQNCTPQLIIEYYKAGATTPFATATPTPITRNVDVAPIDVLAQFSVTGTIPAETAFIRVGGSITCDYIKFDAACLTINCIPVKAGDDGNYTVCDNNLTQINLFDYITGEQSGGVWTLNGQPVSNLVTPIAGSSTNIYVYTVAGTAPCGNDESKVTVTVVPKADAGTDGTYEVCSNALVQINLNDYITGEQTGGTWTVNGQPVANPFTPTAGTSITEYVYTIAGNTPCGNDQSKVTVSVFPTPMITVEAGPDGEVCAQVPPQPGETLPIKTYQLNGTMSGATSVLWTASVPGGSFDDPTKLNAIYTPPVGATTITLTLTSNDPDGPCISASDALTITTVACAGILDPCVCHEVTYLPSETMEVEDFIEIDGATGQEWVIIVNGGAPRTPAQGGGVYGTMQLLDYVPPMDNTPVPIGTIVPETPAGSGIYRYDFAHDSGAGYNVTVKNTQTGQELSISNFCVLNTFQPNFTVGSTICNNASPLNLTSLITDTDPTTTGPAVVDPVGTVDYFYVVAGNPTENPISATFNPGDYPNGTTVKIIAKYTPNPTNVVDCQVIREATGNFTIVNCPLSVNLMSFAGRVANESIILNWKTTDEKDFSHYEIQKSINAKEFATIGSVTGNASKYYNFTDINPDLADNYYRLKIVNNDGSFETSKTISINFEKNKNFVNIENPTLDGSITIGTNLKNPNFSLLASNGSKVETTTISNGLNKFVVKPNNAVTGMYFLNIVSEGKVVTKKVIVR